MGRNDRMAISVAPSNGMAVRLPTPVIASARGWPVLRSTSMPSTITMALSTSIPIARMKVASETRCMVPSKYASTRNEPNTMTIRLNPITMPLRMPMKNISITTTISTDSIRLSTKTPSDSVTRSGW